MTSAANDAFLLVAAPASFKAKSFLLETPIPSPARTGMVTSLLKMMHHTETITDLFWVNARMICFCYGWN